MEIRKTDTNYRIAYKCLNIKVYSFHQRIVDLNFSYFDEIISWFGFFVEMDEGITGDDYRRKLSGMEGKAIGSWLTMKIRPGKEPLDRTLDLPEAFQELLLRLPVRIGDVVSQSMVLGRERIRVEQWKQKNFLNMVRECFSHERGLTMLHREDHVGVLDHVRRDRLRPVIHQFHTQGLRDPDCGFRRRGGYPDVKTRRAGTDPTQIPISRDFPEIPPCKRTPADISLAYEEDGHR
jgi:hypothetical protein